ncbi:MAG: hypothetical protein IJ501_03925 [Bacilli bacterium]|nr:hypothetical protein [Bacilli bacterium]
MRYSVKQQKMINRTGTMMISYALISLLMLILRGWTSLDLILFLFNAIVFYGFQFTTTDKRIISVLCIIVGFTSLIVLKGIIIIFGLILGIYGIILLIKLSKK